MWSEEKSKIARLLVLVLVVVLVVVEGSLNSKLPTIWRVEKQR